MKVFNTLIPNDIPLTNYKIWEYARKLEIPYFRIVTMLDNLPTKVNNSECGIVNLNKTGERGSHWVAYWKEESTRIYFDSYGQITPIEIQCYLKTKSELNQGKSVILRNTDIVQPVDSSICGHLCLFTLKALGEGWTYQEVLNTLREKRLTSTS